LRGLNCRKEEVINDRPDGDRWWEITWPDELAEGKNNRNIKGTLERDVQLASFLLDRDGVTSREVNS
jgi:hypothetical protein